MTGSSPTVRRRRLGAIMRDLRQGAKLTRDEVAESLMCSPAKIAHIETARYKINPRDIRDMLQLYGVDENQAAELLTLARQAQETGWWQNYKDVLRKHFAVYLGLEADASTVRTYEPLLIPGLLQTEDYARAVISNSPLPPAEEEVDRQVTARMTRQERLTRQEALEIWAVIEESALRRPVGDSDVMRAQLDRLVDATKQPNITVQVLPTSVGAHAGMSGPFLILEFPDAADPDVVYVDTTAGELFLEKPDEVRRCNLAFNRLCAAALSPAKSRKHIADVMKEFG